MSNTTTQEDNYSTEAISVKLESLYTLQNIDSEIDRITVLRGELPMEVEDLKLEIEKFAPPTGIRLLLDPQGKPFGPKFPISSFDSLLQEAGPEVVQSLGQIPREMLLGWVTKAKALAHERGQKIKEKYLRAAGDHFKAEIGRLKSLKNSSSNITEFDIEEVRDIAENVLGAIDEGKIRLDALRLILPGE